MLLPPPMQQAATRPARPRRSVRAEATEPDPIIQIVGIVAMEGLCRTPLGMALGVLLTIAGLVIAGAYYVGLALLSVGHEVAVWAMPSIRGMADRTAQRVVALAARLRGRRSQ